MYAENAENATLSYQRGWPRHFQRDPRYDCVLVNLGDRSWSARLRAATLPRAGRFDAIVLLHSVFSNACALRGHSFDAVSQARAPKAFFIGNEYKLMPEKMAFAETLGTNLLVTQSHSARVHELYRSRLGCAVIGLPNTGIDVELFRHERPRAERMIDLGYRSYPSPIYLGHREREQIVAAFQAAAGRHGLISDLSLRPEDRMEEAAWIDFLGRCKGQLGTEAGGDYFELTDATRKAVEAYRGDHPAASFEEVFARFFRDYPDPVPMRIISGRNVEAAGAATVQLLLEGEYGGYLQPGVHYIPVSKNFSNLEEALLQFRDAAACGEITRRAREMALDQLTYSKLLDRFDAALRALI